MIRLAFIATLSLLCCRGNEDLKGRTNTFGQDLSFLQKHDKSLLELKSTDGKARLILSSRHQGRVITTTSGSLDATSYGWINYELIGSGKVDSQFCPVGGEERFWLGPEGG